MGFIEAWEIEYGERLDEEKAETIMRQFLNLYWEMAQDLPGEAPCQSYADPEHL